jgi:hypothetical protein
VSQQYVVHLPSTTEHWFGERAPELGDVVVRHGTRYVVTNVDDQAGRVVVALHEAPEVELHGGAPEARSS